MIEPNQTEQATPALHGRAATSRAELLFLLLILIVPSVRKKRKEATAEPAEA